MNKLQIVLPNESLTQKVYNFFEVIKHFGEDKFFHPHSFDAEFINELCFNEHDDLYYFLCNNVEIIGYGMLRGWEQGYKIPYLGIYISPYYRGKCGISKMFMNFLHCAASIKGAETIRLKVYKDNDKAINLYKSLGYTILDFDDFQYLGELKL